ncbi:MAG TPA: PVC-type heme-binding CxxCH protein, partial [Gemmataceae bacterium]|nr:PVC-type heme-binding CxxCH protein [Gemmataceae bacterium]
MKVCVLFIVPLAVLLSILQVLANDRPLSPAEAPGHMTLPAGFHVTLFAGEPDVVQPIAFALDDRGRLWVAECLSYPDWIKDGKPGHDRILIFEDRDGDGHFDSCKVFCDNLANVSGLALGHGGVWVCATPNLLFIPCHAGSDKPAGAPQILLDGWDLRAQHNIFNDLTWGPDGWLYGCNGIMSNSRVGKPGTPDNQRVPLNCGVWRYHPTRHTFEVVANGTTNPWGLDFNDLGQMFITNCVIKHLWHVIPGAHFQRMYGQDLNPNVYDLMESPADHIHWAGGPWTDSRGGQGKHGEAGGGHAHVGCMVYLGDNWPDRYRGHLFMCNLHGNRVNQDVLERRGSGYVAHHGHDFLMAHDTWFRGLALRYGPDGGVFITDWTDTGECHNYKQIDRSNGRIYKLTYGQTKPWHGDIARLPDADLVQLQLHKNDWFVRHARRVLQERAAAGKLAADTQQRLRDILEHNPDVTRQLRALWALHVIGGLNRAQYLQALTSREEAIRGWAIQLALEKEQAWPALLHQLAEMAVHDPSPWVRLYLASALQRLPVQERWGIAEGLLQHAEDASDQNLPLMIWYGTEPLVGADIDRAVRLIQRARIPRVREFLARRVADPGRLVALLTTVQEPDVQADVLRGLHAAFEGYRHVPMPAAWQTVFNRLTRSANAEVRQRALSVALLFGDHRATAILRQTLMDKEAPQSDRLEALRALLGSKDPSLPPLLQKLVTDPAVRGAAIRGLAAYADPATPKVILTQFPSFDAAA